MRREEILGAFVGDEDRLVAEEGSASERAALRRRHSVMGYHRGGEASRLQRLASRAASGDAQAKARLQAVQSRLQSRASSGDQRAAAHLQQLQAFVANPSAPAPAAASPTTYPSAYPPAYPTQYPQGYQYPQGGYPSQYGAYPSAYQYGYPNQYAYQAPQYAYQSANFDPSLGQNPLGPPPAPTIDVFQGDDASGAFVGDDEEEAAAQGSRSDREALARRRGASPTVDQRKAAVRAILEPALASKYVGRADLRQAIDAGSQPGASVDDKVATGRKILDFLSKRGVQVGPT